MPTRSKKPCAVSGCPALTSERWCLAHSSNKHVSRSYDDRRGSSYSRGYDGQWRKLRTVALQRDNFLCQECLLTDRPTPATDVDHIVPIARAPERRLDLSNLRSLCHSCHAKKTLREDGAFGNKTK